MSDIVQSMLAGLGTAGVVLTISGFWLQKYAFRRLETHFSILESRLKGTIETATSLRLKRLERTAELLPLLQKRASACRNAFQEFAKSKEDLAFKRFSESRESYIDCLYEAQLLLPLESYDSAHRLKRIFDAVFVSVGTCEDLVSAPVQQALVNGHRKIDEGYQLLNNSLRQVLQSIESVEAR